MNDDNRRPGIPWWFGFGGTPPKPKTELEALIEAEEAAIERERQRQQWLRETAGIMIARGTDKKPKQ